MYIRHNNPDVQLAIREVHQPCVSDTPAHLFMSPYTDRVMRIRPILALFYNLHRTNVGVCQNKKALPRRWWNRRAFIE